MLLAAGPLRTSLIIHTLARLTGLAGHGFACLRPSGLGRFGVAIRFGLEGSTLPRIVPDRRLCIYGTGNAEQLAPVRYSAADRDRVWLSTELLFTPVRNAKPGDGPKS